MLSEDQYMDRTPDLIARVRKMREAAEKEMNRFTRAADYNVRRVVDQKPKQPSQPTAQPVPTETAGKSKRSPEQQDTGQLVLEIPPAPTDRGDDGSTDEN